MSVIDYIKPICWSVLTVGVCTILFKRTRKRLVSFSEIEDWIRSVCLKGDVCHISLLANMPDAVRKGVRKQNGIAQVVNGYKEKCSIFATITDAENNIKTTKCFMGKELDNELQQALSHVVELRLKV